MLTYRLVRVIEYHSDALAASLSRKVQSCDRTESYRNVPPEELKERVHEIYHHLGTWLIDKTAAEISRDAPIISAISLCVSGRVLE